MQQMIDRDKAIKEFGDNFFLAIRYDNQQRRDMRRYTNMCNIIALRMNRKYNLDMKVHIINLSSLSFQATFSHVDIVPFQINPTI